ncbi:TPA: glycosyltransferase family 2 protein [Klebsiella pneumoniae]
MTKCVIAIPTYNGNELWREVVSNLKKYVPSDITIQIVDSGSTDGTVELASEAGFKVMKIRSEDFNHGGTRNLAVSEYLNEFDIAIFLTQDAIPEKGFIEEIIRSFNDPLVVCAYGRQLPHEDANPIAQHARFFSYPSTSKINDMTTVSNNGIKTVFMSNSFSAYRLSVFKELGGFPSNTILCEDMFFTAKAILSGYKLAYVSKAIVRHSHNYTPLQEFRRYFDIGVFHKDCSWIQQKFGGTGGEGKKYILSELKYLLKNGAFWIPVSVLNNFMKIVGYKLGKNYHKISKSLILNFSMHKKYWR